MFLLKLVAAVRMYENHKNVYIFLLLLFVDCNIVKSIDWDGSDTGVLVKSTDTISANGLGLHRKMQDFLMPRGTSFKASGQIYWNTRIIYHQK